MAKLHLLFPILLIHLSLTAQVQHSFFHHLTTSGGLSQANNSFVFHDSRGFVWISSIDGLNRFDGLEVRVYRPNDHQLRSMMGGNIISPVFEAPNGDLWFCSTSAVNCYRRRTDDFDHWQIKDPDSGDTIRAGYNAFHLDHEGFFWLQVGDQCTLFNTKTGAIKPLGPLYGNRCFVDTTSSGKVRGIFAFQYNAKHTFSYTLLLPDGTLQQQKQPSMPLLYDLWIEKDTLVWLASEKGLLALNPVSGKYQTYTLAGNSAVSFRAVKPLDDRQLAISSKGAGLLTFDRKDRKWTSALRHRLGFDFSLSSDEPEELYLDAQHNLWVSDWEFGLNFHNLQKPKIAQVVLSDLQVPYHPATNSLQRLAEDDKGQVWCASESGGLYVFDRERRVQQIHAAPGWPVSDVLQVFFDRNKVLWVLTLQGLYWREPRENKLRFVKNSQDENLKWVSFLDEIGDGRLLLSAKGIAEVVRNANGYVLRKLTLHPTIDNAFIPYFFQAHDGTFLYNLDADVTAVLRPGDTLRTLPIHNLKACYEDPDGLHIWLATTAGLAKLNKKTLQYYLFDESNGLPNQYLYSVLPDAKGFLWLSSNKGILQFDPKTGKVHTLSPADGVWGNEFYSNVWLQTTSGEIWMGNRDVLNIFRPDALQYLQTLPKIQITDLKVNDLARKTDTYIGECNSLEFPYTENTLSFNFVALEYSDPSKNQLSYKLEGYDEQWVDVPPGTPGFARYAKLPPGLYTFKIRAANSDIGGNEDNKENQQIRLLVILIRAPYWQTWWFWVLNSLVLLALGYAIYRYRLRQIRHEFRLQQRALEYELAAKENTLRAAESEMKALRAQMNPHFIFNSLNSINAFILRNEGKITSAYLLEFAHLIRQVLDNSGSETISLENEILFLESYLKTESLRLGNRMTYEIQMDENIDSFETEIPSMILQPYVENALWHGISPKATGGHIIINFKKDSTGSLLITIEDNGVGREKARELRAQQMGTHQSKGLKITAERLALYDQKRGTQSTVQTTDLTDNTGTACGTRVEVKISNLHTS